MSSIQVECVNLFYLFVLMFKASISGRVRDAAGKALLAKQLGDINNTMPTFDLKTGSLKQKKNKKEKSPVDEALQGLKTLEKKLPI